MSNAPESEPVDAEVIPDGPDPELAGAVDAVLPDQLVVYDPSDKQELMVVMDNHDIAALTETVQTMALRKWVYDLPGRDGAYGLTVHAVEDITQRMNWSGKTRIGLMPETLQVVIEQADEGRGPEPFYVATIFAKDEITGAMQPGTAMEPQWMQLTVKTAERKRGRGELIPADNKVFDRYARTKAIQKAKRNAMAAFIPEEIEQTVIAMFIGDASRVKKIQTVQQEKVSALPPPLTDDRAVELLAAADALYDQIRECGGGQGKVKLPPGQYAAYRLQSQHAHDALERFIDYLQGRLKDIPVEVAREERERVAVETATEIKCPVCEQGPRQWCKGVKGSHQERIVARLAQLPEVIS